MIAEAAARYLAGQGLGILGQTITTGMQPDTPDDHVSLFDESAPSDGAPNILAEDNVGVQVLARAKQYPTARDLAWSIHRKLVGFSGELDAEFPRVFATTIVTAPSSVGLDEKRRFEFSAHYAMRIASSGDSWRT